MHTAHRRLPPLFQPAAPPSRRSSPAPCQRSDAQAEAFLPSTPLPLPSICLPCAPSSPVTPPVDAPFLLTLLTACSLAAAAAAAASARPLRRFCCSPARTVRSLQHRHFSPPLGPPACARACLWRHAAVLHPLPPTFARCVRTGCSSGCSCRCTGRLDFCRAAAQPSRLLPAAHSPSFAPQYPLSLCLMGPRGTCPCALVPCGASGRAQPPLWLPRRLQNDACC